MDRSSKSKSLYEAILDNAAVRRLGELILVNFSTQGAAIVLNGSDFQALRKRAQQKHASNNPQYDFQQLLAWIDCYVARRGCGIPSKGSPAHLLRLAKAMPALGLDHKDWNFPESVVDEID